MRSTRYLLIAFALTLLVSAAAAAQTTRKRPVKRAPAPARTASLPPLDVRAARVKVSNQLANITDFIVKLGPVARAIEDVDAQAARGRANGASIDKNTSNKQKVVTAIRGLREGMMKLESEFRVKPALKKYLTSMQGISDLAGEAEDSAVSGKFVSATTPLRAIQQKLNDTLSAMPTAEL